MESKRGIIPKQGVIGHFSAIQHALDGFKLRHDGDHGLFHWARVVENGRRLADRLGLSRKVTDLFGILHDSKRNNEYVDRDHGQRSAVFIRHLAVIGVIDLRETEIVELEFACRFHSTGRRDGPLIAQICWDADRLDLGRVGIEPNRGRLCTEAAKAPDIFDWAYERGIDRAVSNVIREEWKIHWDGDLLRK
jgi:uncharacterized protein